MLTKVREITKQHTMRSYLIDVPINIFYDFSAEKLNLCNRFVSKLQTNNYMQTLTFLMPPPLRLTVTSLLLLLASVYGSLAMTISGPTVVCPGQTYTYTVNSSGLGENLFFLDQNGASVPISPNRVGTGNTFSITFGGSVGSAVITVKTYYPNTDVGFVSATATLNVVVRVPTPSQPTSPDGYLILACSPNEQITINSLPALGNNPDDCYFHCAIEWSAPSGWTLDNLFNAIGNPIYGTQSGMKLIAPNGSSNGYAGQLSVSAYYSECGQQQNTSSSSTVWYGTPNIYNAQANGQPANGFNVVGSSAYLTVQSDAASSYTWTILNGNGYIYPSGNSCNVSVNGFVRVEAKANNRCGNGSTHTFYLSTSSSGGYRVYPNPTRNQVSVDFESNELASDEMTGIDILNEKGNIVKSFDNAKAKKNKYFSDTKVAKLDVNDLPRGTYFLHVSYGKQVFKSQIVLE